MTTQDPEMKELEELLSATEKPDIYVVAGCTTGNSVLVLGRSSRLIRRVLLKAEQRGFERGFQRGTQEGLNGSND